MNLPVTSPISLPPWTEEWLTNTERQSDAMYSQPSQAEPSPQQATISPVADESDESWRKWLLHSTPEPIHPDRSSPTSLPTWTKGWLLTNKGQSSTSPNPTTTPSPTPKRKKQKQRSQTVPPGNAKVLYFSDSMGHKVNPLVEKATFISSAHCGAKVVHGKGKSQPSLSLLKDAMQGDEKAVILQHGANDVTTGIPVTQFKLHYARLAKQASVNGADVICCGILHRGDGKPTNVTTRNRRVDELNAAIMEVCHEEGYTYVNNTGAIRSSANNPRLDILNRSKLHLNENGKLSFARRLARVTSKVLKSGTIPCPLPPRTKTRPTNQRQSQPAAKDIPSLLHMKTNSNGYSRVDAPHPHPPASVPPSLPAGYMPNPYNPYVPFPGPAMMYPHYPPPRPMF